MSSTNRLRVLVAVPAGPVPLWRSEALRALKRSGHEVVILAAQAAPVDLEPVWRALYTVHRLLARQKRDVFARVDRSQALLGLEEVPQDMVGRLHPDVILSYPEANLAPDALASARYGVWEITPPHTSGFFPGAAQGVMRWTRHGRAPRLAQTTLTCVRGPFAAPFVREHFAKAALFPVRALTRLAREGEAYWSACPSAPAIPPEPHPVARLAQAVAALCACTASRAWQDLLHRRQWFLAWRKATQGPGDALFRTNAFTVVPLPGRFGQADPFLFAHQGRCWCFFERIPPAGPAHIAAAELLPDRRLGPARTVLKEPFHLSYPFVFEHEGQPYMIPETGQAQGVRLYRATDFPEGWAFTRELLSGVTAVDATLHHKQGVWWLFVTIRPPHGSSWDELHLYSAASPLGPFTPHPNNPVVSDVSRARPAGRILEINGRLYRPGQDSTGWYGRGLKMMEISRLDHDGYEERHAASLAAELIPGSFCLHTFQAGHDIEIVDGQRFVPLWRWLRLPKGR